MSRKKIASVSKWGRINVIGSGEIREGVIIEFKDSIYDEFNGCIRKYYRNEYGTVMAEEIAEFDLIEFSRKSPEKVTKKLRKLIKAAFGEEKTRIYIDKELVDFFEVDDEAMEQEMREETLMQGIS